MDWQINIPEFDGYCPAYWSEDYPILGNRGSARDIQAIDLLSPHFMTQGPGLATLTTGDQAAAVTTLIKGMIRNAVASSVTYGVGGNKLYKITPTAVTNTGGFPHTIDKGTVTAEDGEDVCFYQSNIYYSYNHSGTAGDIGQYNVTSGAFDDDYMSTVPVDAIALIGGVPHQMIVGGDNIMYITNGKYIASFDGTTFIDQALNLPDNFVMSSIQWANNRIYVSANRENISGTNQNESSIFIWDTYSTSWEMEVKVGGKIGALYSKNGIVRVWYQDVSYTGGYKLAYLNGYQLQDLQFYSGTLPEYYQVDEYKNHMLFVSSGKIKAWGAQSSDSPVKFFELADGGHATVGGLAVPFGTPLIASDDGAGNTKLAKFSGYDLASYLKTIYYQIANGDQKGRVERVIIYTNPLSTGDKVDTTLRYDFGKSNVALKQIAYDASNNTTRHIILDAENEPDDAVELENFSLELDFANGSVTNPVKIRGVFIGGSYIQSR
jgi:hypothetical protein